MTRCEGTSHYASARDTPDDLRTQVEHGECVSAEYAANHEKAGLGHIPKHDMPKDVVADRRAQGSPLPQRSPRLPRHRFRSIRHVDRVAGGRPYPSIQDQEEDALS